MIPGKEEFLKKQRFREETLFQKRGCDKIR